MSEEIERKLDEEIAALGSSKSVYMGAPDHQIVEREEWFIRILDPILVAKAALEGRVPLDYVKIIVNRDAILLDARRAGPVFKCDGVKAWRETVHE